MWEDLRFRRLYDNSREWSITVHKTESQSPVERTVVRERTNKTDVFLAALPCIPQRDPAPFNQKSQSTWMKPTSQPQLPLRHRTVDVIASHEATGHAAAYEAKAAPTPTHRVLTHSGCKAKGHAGHHAVKEGIWTGGSHTHTAHTLLLALIRSALATPASRYAVHFFLRASESACSIQERDGVTTSKQNLLSMSCTHLTVQILKSSATVATSWGLGGGGEGGRGAGGGREGERGGERGGKEEEEQRAGKRCERVFHACSHIYRVGGRN